MNFVTREAGSDLMVGHRADDGADAQRLMVRALRKRPSILIYRINSQGNGDIELKLQQIETGTDTYDQSLTDATFEDVNT